ncbi:MAG: FAD-dependent oxidoreductase [Pseudomonadota bacterium]
MIKKLAIVAVIVAAFVAFYLFGGREYLLPATYQSLYAEHPRATLGIYFAVYVLVAALSIPGAALFTLIAGAVFGLGTGTLLVSFASSIGATLAFLSSRLVLRSAIESRFERQLKRINQGIEKDGALYLFALRLIPAFPFVVINLAMGLTKLRIGTYYVVSQLGMLPGTLVYVNAGAQLGDIEQLSAEGILRPQIIGAFLLLAVFPFIVKALFPIVVEPIADMWKSFRVSRPWRAHKHDEFDQNLVVIGAGSGGLVSAYIAAAIKAEVTLIERAEMGGDCLNTGCVPSKALIRSAKARNEIANAARYGLTDAGANVDFPAVMRRVHGVIADIEPHDSVERYEGLGVNVIKGEATVTSPWTVEVNGKAIRTKNIILATGGEPFVPPIPGLDEVPHLTSDTLWSLQELPRRLLVVGGGPIGAELAQAFHRLGSKVTVVDMADRLLTKEDEDVSAFIAQRFAAEGIDVVLGQPTSAFGTDGDGSYAVIGDAEDGGRIYFDQTLIAVGRKPRSKGVGFDALELDLRRDGTVDVNEFMQTKYPNVFACGDVTGPFQFTHVAAHQAWYAAVNALFRPLKKFKADYRVIPWTTFTDPEVAHVGLSETDAREQDIDYDVTKYGIDDLDRAIADGVAEGFVKVLTEKGKDRILGVTIVGHDAGNLLAEYVLAMKYNIGLNKILGTIHAYPTLAEANKFVAGEWKRANAPQKLLAWVGKFHAWRRA